MPGAGRSSARPTPRCSSAATSGGFWDFASSFSLNTAGYWIVGTFVAVWALAIAVWKYGEVETRWETAAARHRAARGEFPDLAAAGLE